MGTLHVPLRAFALSAALLLQLLPSMLAQSNFSFANFTTHPANVCRWSEASAALGRIVPAGDIVMAPVWYGPEILWRSDLRVLSGPYEMLPAMVDTAKFFEGDEAAARSVVVRRGISYAIVCQNDGGTGFGQKLASGIAPGWLRSVALKGGPKEFRLYQVVP